MKGLPKVLRDNIIKQDWKGESSSLIAKMLNVVVPNVFWSSIFWSYRKKSMIQHVMFEERRESLIYWSKELHTEIILIVEIIIIFLYLK